MSLPTTTMIHILTFDVEDWFHTFHTRYYTKTDIWEQLPSSLDRNLDILCEFLDKNNIRATFFWLGWSALRHKELVRKVEKAGHEIGIHSCFHRKISDLNPKTFRKDIKCATQIIEDVTGKKVCSYRAPGFSIDHKSLWTFEILSELGFENDSSLRTGLNLSSHIRVGQQPFIITNNHFQIKEYPVVGLHLFGRSFNYTGSGYFRITPFCWMKRKILNTDYLMYYFHPRDFDERYISRKDKNWIFQLRYGTGTRTTYQKLTLLSKNVDLMNLEEANQQIKWDEVPHNYIE